MHEKGNFPQFVRITSLPRPALKPFALSNQNGTILYILDALLVRILSETIGFSFKIHLPPDGEFGKKLPNGQWTGMIGMLQRQEADLAVSHLTITAERLETVSFSFPYDQLISTFMTDKPQPIPAGFTLFDPFPFSIWIVLIISLFLLSFFFYKVYQNRLSYPSVLYNLCAALLGQAMMLKIQSSSSRFLMFSWLLCTFILAHCYRGIISADLAFPFKEGIKTIADLSRAASEHSVQCYTIKGSYYQKGLLLPNDESFRNIAKCLKLTENSTTEDFSNLKERKAFLATKKTLQTYENDFFISDEIIFRDLNAIGVSKNFCCLEKLNIIIHRITEAGLYQKYISEFLFHNKLKHIPVSYKESEIGRTITLSDISAAFYVLCIGYSLGIAILLLEVIAVKCSSLMFIV